MNIGILTIAFAEQDFIRANIKQFESFDLQHFILVSEKPWRGDFEQDETINIAEQYCENVVSGYWPNQAEQFNYGLEILQQLDYDWAIIVDADEFYEKHSIKNIIEKIKKTEADALTAPILKVYWRTSNYRIFPSQLDNPIIAIKTNQRFTDKRWSECSKESCNNTVLHHFSYVRSDETMWTKINTFEHSHEFDVKKWYDEVWKTWQPNRSFIHPVVPEQFKFASYDPAPQEIKKLFYDKS